MLQRPPSVSALRDRWRSLSVTVRDALIAPALVLLGFFPPLAEIGTRLGELPVRPLDATGVAAGLAMTLPLVVRRRLPAVALAVVGAGFAVQELRGYATFASIGLLVAIYSAGAYLERLRWVVAGLAIVAYASLAAALVTAGSPATPDAYPLFLVALAAAWAVGAWIRSYRAAETERRRSAARAALAAERERIARELHDVVTHHVTAMVVQAGAAQVSSAEEKVTASLAAIGETGRRALGELRDLLGVLDPAHRGPMDRLPTLAEVEELVVQSRAAGQPVELRSEGTRPDLGAGRELAAYRVVQEGLTNALKHATGSRTLVRLGHRADAVDIEVSTFGAPASTGARAGGSGRGLAGLRERVELFGGTFHAGPRPDGGFTLTARIPAGEPQ